MKIIAQENTIDRSDFWAFSKNEKNDSKAIESFVRDFYLLPNQFIYIHNLKSGRFYSNGIQEVLGFYMDMLTPDFFVKHVHPIDLTLYFKLSKAFYKSVLAHSRLGDPSKISLEVNYRIRKFSGAYIPIVRHTSPYIINSKNEVEAFISVCSEISFMSQSNHMRWRINNLSDDIFDKYMNVKPSADSGVFSGREVAVLKLIMAGYSSSRIADKLFLSVNTVNTHRKSLMKKANVNKTVDLISFAVENGYSK